MSDFLKAALLGAIQGATEFLPVSSSGHLKAAEMVFRFEGGTAFDAALHLPTLLAVLWFFRRDLLAIARSSDRWAVLLRVTLGTVPAVVIALGFRDLRESLSPWFLVGGWTISGLYLLTLTRREGALSYPRLHPGSALVVGGTQGLAAICPGLSRSGLTITSGLLLGLRRDEACRFSFLLSIPITLGAGLKEGSKVLRSGGLAAVPGGWPAMAAAMLLAFAVGLAAIHFLFRSLAKNGFHRFGWYNLFAAAAFALFLWFVQAS